MSLNTKSTTTHKIALFLSQPKIQMEQSDDYEFMKDEEVILKNANEIGL